MVIVELLQPSWKFPWQGNFPHPQLADTINIKISEAVKKEERPIVPNDNPANIGLIELMRDCWKHNPADRPNARELEFKVTQMSNNVRNIKTKVNDLKLIIKLIIDILGRK